MTCFFYPYRLYDSGFAPSALSLRLKKSSCSVVIMSYTKHVDQTFLSFTQTFQKLQSKRKTL